MDLSPKDAELIIGLVARIGVDTRAASNAIAKVLSKFEYSVEELHVTDLLDPFSDRLGLVHSPAETRYESYISACNRLRADLGTNVMASLAIAEIVARRGGRPELSRSAYIINQIKRPEEFELLRSVYGEHYVQISLHAGEEQRIKRLTDRIVGDHPEDPKGAQWDIHARQLVAKDESEEGEPCGQRVQKVFPLSDAVIDANRSPEMEVGISRFLRLLFGDQSVTPTKDEYGMELANTAALRSSDLSRQVGASIFNQHMEVQALGCNEVPKAGGGTYWEGDDPDGRDHARGVDANELRKRAVLMDIFGRLHSAGALRDGLESPESRNALLFNREDDLISDAQVMDSLEYGRAVHAEMNAITDAARGGHNVRGSVLYSNTFPCHNCAKHIVASGITEVVYIRPFTKSYTKELFEDSIRIDGKGSGGVAFRIFTGIVGPMYQRLFTKSRWKRDAEVVRFDEKTARFIRRTPLPAYVKTEVLLNDELRLLLAAKSYIGGGSPPVDCDTEKA